MASITVLVAARRETTRAACLAALASAPDVRVVGEAGSPAEVVAGVRYHQPLVVVLIAPLGSPRVRILLDTLRRGPRPHVLIVARGRSLAAVLDALARGARGHLEPSQMRDDLARAVRALARGEAWCPRRLVPALVERLRLAGRDAPTDSAPWSNGRDSAPRRG
jgi:DNA-binding NarL/FixJ family response regulator